MKISNMAAWRFCFAQKDHQTWKMAVTYADMAAGADPNTILRPHAGQTPVHLPSSTG